MTTPSRWSAAVRVSKRLWSLWPIAALCVVAGCLSSKTVGQRGALGFGVAGSDIRAPEALDAASLAEGEEVEIVVYVPIRLDPDGSHFTTHDGQRRLPADNARPIDVAQASSSNTDVLEVVGIEGAAVRVRGLSVGVSRLMVQTWQGADVVPVKVESLGYVEIDHPRWSAEFRGSPSRTVLLAGGSITFDARRKSAAGARLVGYGLPSSVAIEPQTAARVVNEPRDLRHLTLEIGEPGRLTLEPASGTTMAFDVIAPEQVESMALVGLGEEPTTVTAIAGEFALLMAIARIADERVVLGLGTKLEVQSRTPEVCRFDQEASSGLNALAWSRWNGFDGPFVVLTPTAGVCELVVRVGPRIFESDFVVAPAKDREATGPAAPHEVVR